MGCNVARERTRPLVHATTQWHPRALWWAGEARQEKSPHSVMMSLIKNPRKWKLYWQKANQWLPDDESGGRDRLKKKFLGGMEMLAKPTVVGGFTDIFHPSVIPQWSCKKQHIVTLRRTRWVFQETDEVSCVGFASLPLVQSPQPSHNHFKSWSAMRYFLFNHNILIPLQGGECSSLIL